MRYKRSKTDYQKTRGWFTYEDAEKAISQRIDLEEKEAEIRILEASALEAKEELLTLFRYLDYVPVLIEGPDKNTYLVSVENYSSFEDVKSARIVYHPR